MKITNFKTADTQTNSTLTKSKLIEIMKATEQTKGLSIYGHGVSVKDYMFDLLGHLRNDTLLMYEWKLPQWVYDNKDFLLENIVSDDILERYTVMHDCGKPFCLTVDEDGRRHFPDHANVSHKIFKQVYPNEPEAAELIKSDMDFHLIKADGLEEFSKNKYAATLMLSALAEIHSNASMFGGIDSVSFKIKWKHTNKRGRQVLDLIKKNII